MFRIIEKGLNFLRKRISPYCRKDKCISIIEERDEAVDIIKKILTGDSPCMIARYGAFEGSTIVNYLGRLNDNHTIIKYIRGECSQWWWNKSLLNKFNVNAGFFPITENQLIKYCQLTINDSKEADIIGCFDNNDNIYYLHNLLEDCQCVRLRHLDPDFRKMGTTQWTSCLANKKVLVIHPFADTIKEQYKKRTLLFSDPDFLPDFELITIKAVQSIGGSAPGFKTWFEALDYMKDEMDKIEYDICILGCGAYGFNLAAHAKRTGHKAIHLGGSTQLLFGIKGKRWEERNEYRNIMNDYWVKPSKSDIPRSFERVEGGCYW